MNIDQAELFQEIPEPKAPPIDFPFFLIAWWPHDQRWKIFSDMWKTGDAAHLQQVIADLRSRGCRYIRICRLPAVS
jgi:hypothetical protein